MASNDIPRQVWPGTDSERRSPFSAQTCFSGAAVLAGAACGLRHTRQGVASGLRAAVEQQSETVPKGRVFSARRRLGPSCTSIRAGHAGSFKTVKNCQNPKGYATEARGIGGETGEEGLQPIEQERYNSDVLYELTSSSSLASTLRDIRAYPARAYERDSGASLLGEENE